MRPSPISRGHRNFAGLTLIQILTRLKLTSGLQLCLDAADGNSYTSGAKWLDTSGNGQDFNLGLTGVGTDLPTFTGAANSKKRSSYWSFDGGDLFSYDSANETWMTNLHKAGAVGTVLAWAATSGTPAVSAICGTGQSATGPGFEFRWSVVARPTFVITNGTSVILTRTMPLPAMPPNVMCCAAFAIDAAAGAAGLTMMMNGLFDFSTSTLVAPSALAALSPMAIGARGVGGANLKIEAGSRAAVLCAWNRRLTTAELHRIYMATRQRYTSG